MKRISKVKKIEQIQNDLKHNDEETKQRKKNSTEFNSMLKEKEERKLKEARELKEEKQRNLNSLDIYKIEIQKQKPFRNIINKTVEKSEENEHDEK